MKWLNTQDMYLDMLFVLPASRFIQQIMQCGRITQNIPIQQRNLSTMGVSVLSMNVMKVGVTPIFIPLNILMIYQ